MPGNKHAAIATKRGNDRIRAEASGVIVSTDDRDTLRAAILASFTAALDLALTDVREGDYLITRWEFHPMDDQGRFRATTIERNSPSGVAWRRAVLARDGHACVRCGATEHLHAHHVEEWATCPELRFDVDNGQTLCRSCHRAEHRAR